MRFRSKGKTSPHTEGNEASSSNSGDRKVKKMSLTQLTQHNRKRLVGVIATICTIAFCLTKSTSVQDLYFHITGLEALDTHSTTSHTEIELDAFLNSKTQRSRGSSPYLIKGWRDKQRQLGYSIEKLLSSLSQEKFDQNFGNYTQYVKNQFVQPFEHRGEKCIAPAGSLQNIMKASEDNILFFTNDKESPDFINHLRTLYEHPGYLNYSDAGKSFHVFSLMVKGSYHGFHKHDEAHIQQVHGRKMWWLLPPETPTPPKDNPCTFLNRNSRIPNGKLLMILQEEGDTMFIPPNWWHATCALDDWTLAIGMQKGSPHKYKQKFDVIPQPYVKRNANGVSVTEFEKKHPMPWKGSYNFYQRLSNCGITFNSAHSDSWKWFDGDLNKYYNELIGSDSKRNPNEIKTYAVHRWLGEDRSTLTHYKLILDTILAHTNGQNLNVLDAGCGLGAGLMWFETNGPKSMKLTGHTISTEQLEFINNLPRHKFDAVLKSYDDLEDYKDGFDVIYSIEAFIHSPNERKTLENWSKALKENGIIVIIDDFLNVGVDKTDADIELFSKSWMANVLQSTGGLNDIAERFGLNLVLDRDLGSEYQVNKRNYRNKLPMIAPTEAKNHQGWLGSMMRQQLMIQGKITYRLIVLQKQGFKSVETSRFFNEQNSCASVPSVSPGEEVLKIDPIYAEHKTGADKNGGSSMKCISGWYCCGMGYAWWENINKSRTHNTGYLKLDKKLFGDYMDKMTDHLNQFYGQLPSNIRGKFLDIGGTGSVSSGMRKVTSKFSHFSGPFDYWVLDADSAAKSVDNALHCDMSDCPIARDCEFDVTFSHTVLEHTPYPWKAFDEIARITKTGGLTMHVVPFSYQYHATPDDNFRFSHKALTSLLEDRGFSVLDVGYDVCTKPENVLKNNIDEHFDTIWLTYVIGVKK